MLKSFAIKCAAICTLGLISVSPTLAANSGIMSNRLNECAIYLCLPQGFPGSACQPALKSFRDRITKFTKKGARVYTDLPDMANCIDVLPDNLSAPVAPENQSNVTHKGGYLVFMPAINKCTRWGSRTDVGDQMIYYCAAVVTTPAYTFESQERKHPYETINVGDTGYSQYLAPVKRFTEVLVDGKITGERYYE